MFGIKLGGIVASRHGRLGMMAAALMVACGSSESSGTGGTGGTGGAGGAGGVDVDSGGGGSAGALDGSVPSDAAGAAGAAPDAAPDALPDSPPDAGEVLDPAKAGPFPVGQTEATVPAPAVGSEVATTCFVPEASGGSVPLVTLAPGFQLPPEQYYVSASHLASFGFVVCVAAYNASLFEKNHVDNAREVLAVIDWALDPAGPLAGRADAGRVGAAGHSLGGRLSVLAASFDDRIRAVFGMDPKDSDDPDASDLLPLDIPTGFLGELVDAQGGFQPCAPAEHNFQTFYARAASPSFAVELLGANHMSFLDAPDSCGLVCSLCNDASLDHDTAISLTRSYLAAFFMRHLRDEPAYDSYLTGSIATERYVSPGIAIIQSK